MLLSDSKPWLVADWGSPISLQGSPLEALDQSELTKASGYRVTNFDMCSTTGVEQSRSPLPRLAMSDLTSLQLAVLHVLWESGESSVTAVAKGLLPGRDLAPTTVATLLSRLEKRGVIGRRRKGRGFVYRALVERSTTQTGMVDDLARDLFEGDVSNLVHHLLSRGEIAGDDLDKVKALIAAREAELGGQA